MRPTIATMAQANNGYIATVDRVIDFMFPYSMLNSKDILQEMERIQYNPERDDNKIELSKILDWINTVNTDNQYISNLKIERLDLLCLLRNQSDSYLSYQRIEKQN